MLRSGWILEPATDSTPCTLPRFLSASDELKEFLASFAALHTAADKAWLIASGDFGATPQQGFAWNEFELLSLSASADDSACAQQVRSFWQNHLPIFMSVENHYEYVAYCLSGPRRGSYVHGAEPEFEDTRVVAHDLDEFVAWLIAR